MLKINNLGVSILYVDAFSFTQMLHRTNHELKWISGVVGCNAQIDFTQMLHRFFECPKACAPEHINPSSQSVFSNHRDNELRRTTMTSTTTKIYGALIGTGIFFALGTAMADAQAFCDRCF